MLMSDEEEEDYEDEEDEEDYYDTSSGVQNGRTKCGQRHR